MATTMPRKVLLWGGVVGPALFTATWLIDGAVRPDYSPTVHWVSSLAATPAGWALTAAFLVAGVLLVGFGLGLRLAIREGRAAVVGPTLVVLAGLAFLAGGVFPIDPSLGYPVGTTESSLAGAIHEIVGPIYFGTTAAAAFIYARRFARPVFLSCAITTIVAWVASGVLAASYYGGWTSAPAGLAERLALIASMAWMVFLAISTLRGRTK